MGLHFGVPSSAIAYLPAAYGLTYGGIALFAGPLSDRFGRKRPLQSGLLGFAIFSALTPVAPSLGAAIALSALTGLCAAIIQPNAWSLAADLSPPVTAFASALRVLLFVLPISSPVQLGLIGIPWAFGYGYAGPLHHAGPQRPVEPSPWKHQFLPRPAC